jgi:hypothetical protein
MEMLYVFFDTKVSFRDPFCPVQALKCNLRHFYTKIFWMAV